MSGRISAGPATRIVLTSILGFWAVQVYSDDKPQPKPPPTVEQRLAPFIAAIKETKDPATAQVCYVKGLSIDNSSVALHEAYMKRMLTFGLPQYAEMPAKALVNIDSRNGMAWGVIGCMNGKRGDYAAALPACIRAAALLPGDAGIMNNAGQLMVWYENTLDTPELSDAIKRIIDNLRNKWDQNEAFAKSYKKVHDAYIARDKLDKDTTDKMATLEDSMLAVQRNFLDAQAKLTDVSQQLQNKQLEALSLSRQMLTAPPFIVNGGMGPLYAPTITYGGFGGYPYFPCGGGYWPWFGFGDGLNIGFGGSWGNFSMFGSLNSGFYSGPFCGGGIMPMGGGGWCGGGFGGGMPAHVSGFGSAGYPLGHVPPMPMGGGCPPWPPGPIPPGPIPPGPIPPGPIPPGPWPPGPWPCPWPYPTYPVGYSTPYAEDIWEQIGELASSINSLKKQGVSLQSDCNELRADLDRKKKGMAKLLKQAGLVDKLLTRNFRWDPPSVDGVLTAEVDNYVMGTPKGPIPKDPEGEADRLLSLAKMLIGSQDYPKAAESINKIINDYPDTAAAKQVEKLIKDAPDVKPLIKK